MRVIRRVTMPPKARAPDVSDPPSLVGVRVRVMFEEGTGHVWYGGTVTEYHKSTKCFQVLYDDHELDEKVEIPNDEVQLCLDEPVRSKSELRKLFEAKAAAEAAGVSPEVGRRCKLLGG